MPVLTPSKEKTKNTEKKPSRLGMYYEAVKRWLARHPIMLAICLSVSVTLINEIFNRHSIIDGIIYAVCHPLIFLAGCSIVMIFNSLALMTRKRYYFMGLFSLIWLGLGITNFIVLFFRQTPFSTMDFTLMKSVFPIFDRYLGLWGLILCCAILLFACGYMIYRFFKAKKHPLRLRYGIVSFLSSCGVSALLIGSALLFGIIPTHFYNLCDAYRDYGFQYCFSVSLIDRGIRKPNHYEESIEDIIKDLGNNAAVPTSAVGGEQPNIIFLQLESFCNVNRLPDFSFSSDPIPFYSSLKAEFGAARFRVPSIGAGTANTEFEVLTGMSLQHFGAGEYPYETIMQKSTCESLAYLLGAHGYGTHAIHNYKADFYDRANVFSRLGFDTFTPLEYMSGVKQNILDWAEDRVLTRYILSALSSTDTPDFVYGITVQCHGKYPQSAYEGFEEEPITITDCPDSINKFSFTYYINQMRETDRFIEELTTELCKLPEKTIVVMFGDHLPNIGINEDMLPNGDTLYDTEYLIWHNFDMNHTTDDLFSYQIGSEVMRLLGYNNGMITKLHQNRDRYPEEYLDRLLVLEYDLLYGDIIAYHGKNLYQQTELRLGTEPITVSGCCKTADGAAVFGQNFTLSSVVYLNSAKIDTTYQDENTLLIEDVPDSGDIITVVQSAGLFSHLGETDPYTVP